MLVWYILIPISLFNFAVGFAVLRRDFRAPMNWAFFAFAVSVGAWVFTIILLMRAWSEESAIFFAAMAHFMGILIAATLWILSRAFRQHRELTKREWRLVSIPSAIMCALTLWPGAFAIRAEMRSWIPEVFINPAYHIAFIIFFSTFFFWGLFSLARYARQGSRRLACHQARCLYRGLILTASGGIFFNIVFVSPFIQQFQFAWVGPLFTIFFIIAAHHARTRYFFGITKAVDAVVLVEDIPSCSQQFRRFLQRAKYIFFARGRSQVTVR